MTWNCAVKAHGKRPGHETGRCGGCGPGTALAWRPRRGRAAAGRGAGRAAAPAGRCRRSAAAPPPTWAPATRPCARLAPRPRAACGPAAPAACARVTPRPHHAAARRACHEATGHATRPQGMPRGPQKLQSLLQRPGPEAGPRQVPADLCPVEDGIGARVGLQLAHALALQGPAARRPEPVRRRAARRPQLAGRLGGAAAPQHRTCAGPHRRGGHRRCCAARSEQRMMLRTTLCACSSSCLLRQTLSCVESATCGRVYNASNAAGCAPWCIGAERAWQRSREGIRTRVARLARGGGRAAAPVRAAPRAAGGQGRAEVHARQAQEAHAGQVEVDLQLQHEGDVRLKRLPAPPRHPAVLSATNAPGDVPCSRAARTGLHYSSASARPGRTCISSDAVFTSEGFSLRARPGRQDSGLSPRCIEAAATRARAHD